MLTPNAYRLNPADGLVTVPEVARAAGLSRGAMRTAIDDGLVTPAAVRRGPGRGGAQTITLEDALLILAVAALAAAAGVAFVTMLRAMRGTGATVTPYAVVVPLPSASSVTAAARTVAAAAAAAGSAA